MTTQLPQCIPATMHCTPIEPCPTIRPPCYQGTHVQATNCPPATVCPQPSTLCPPPQGGVQNFAVTPTAATVCTQFGCQGTMATVCTQIGCHTYPQGDCTFFDCPTRICGGDPGPAPRPDTYVLFSNCPPATVCPQPSTLCPPQHTPATVCTQINCPPRTNIPPCPPTNMPGCPNTATCPQEDDGKRAAVPPPDSQHICATTYTQPISVCGPCITPGTCLTTQGPTSPMICRTVSPNCPGQGCLPLTVGPVLTPPGQQQFAAQAVAAPLSAPPHCPSVQPCHTQPPFCPILSAPPHCPTVQHCPPTNMPGCPRTQACPPQTHYPGCGCLPWTVGPVSVHICPPTDMPGCPKTAGCPPHTQHLAGAVAPAPTPTTWPTPQTHCFVCPGPTSDGCDLRVAAAAPQAQAFPQSLHVGCFTINHPHCPIKTLNIHDCILRTRNPLDCLVWTRNSPLCPQPCHTFSAFDPVTPQQQQFAAQAIVPPPLSAPPHCPSVQPCHTQPPFCPVLSAPPNCPTVQHCPPTNMPGCPRTVGCPPQYVENLAAAAPQAQAQLTITLHPTPATHCFICPPFQTRNPWDCFVWTRNSPLCPQPCITGSVFDPITPVAGGQQFAARAAAPQDVAIAHTPATVCTQFQCHTQPNGDCTFFGGCQTKDCTAPSHCGPCISPLPPCDIKTLHCTVPPQCPDPLTARSQCGPCITPNPPCDVSFVISQCGPCITHDLSCHTSPQPGCTRLGGGCPSALLSQCGPCVTDLHTCHPQQCLLTAPPQCPIKTDPATCGVQTFGGCFETPQQFVAQRAPLTPPVQGPQNIALTPHTAHWWCTRLVICTQYGCLTQGATCFTCSNTCLVTCAPAGCITFRQPNCTLVCP